MILNGKVIKINLDKDYRKYSKVLTSSGQIIYFNDKTKISGCKFNQLEVGDKVVVKAVTTSKTILPSPIVYATYIELRDIVEKWETILEKDGHVKLSKMEYGSMIKPEEFNTNSPYLVKNQNNLSQMILERTFKNEKYKQIMQLYAEGKSLREIGKIVGYKAVQSVNYVIKKHLKMWGIDGK